MKKTSDKLSNISHNKTWPIFCLIQIIAFVFLLGIWSYPHDDVAFHAGKCMVWDEGWTFSSSPRRASIHNDSMEPIENGVRLTCTIPMNREISAKYIAKYSVFQEVKAYLNGVMIYDSTDSDIESSFFSNIKGSYWIFIPLPEDARGQKFIMEITSAYKNYQDGYGQLLLGEKTDIFSYIIRDNLPGCLVAALFILSGVCFLILSLTRWKYINRKHSCIYFSSFLYWAGMWLLSESHLTQFLFNSALLTSLLAFISVRLFIISLLAYGITTEHFSWKRGFEFFAFLYSIEFVFSMATQLSGFLDYYRMMPLFTGLTVCAMLFVVLSCIHELKVQKKYQHYYASFLILCFGGAIELSIFSTSARKEMQLVLGITLLCSVFLLIYTELSQLNHTIQQGRKVEYYRLLANTDLMTNCFSHTKMIEDIREYSNQPELLKNVTVIMCDINDLKYINDHFGHEVGDHMITACATALKEQFDSIGSCYRYGGDEFLCFIHGQPESEIVTRIQRIEAIMRPDIKENGSPQPQDFSAAIAYALADIRIDHSIEDVIHRADLAMYQKKKQMK